MPDITSYGDQDGASQIGAMTYATPQMYQSAAQTVAPNPGESHNWVTTTLGDTALGAVDLVDTVASSIPGVSKVTGINRGDIDQRALAAIGRPGVTDFFNQNKTGIQIASTVEGLIGTSILAGKLGKIAAPYMNTLKTVPYAGRLASLEDSYQAAMGTVRAVDTEIAASGVTGAEAWSSYVSTARATEAEAIGARAINTTRNSAVNRATGLSFAKGAVGAVGNELLTYTLMNQNDILYSQDEGQNLMWQALGVAGGGLFHALGTGYQIRKFANSDLLNRLKANALDPTGLEAARLDTLKPTDKAPSFLGSLQGTVTDKVTSYMTSAKAALPQGVDPNTFTALATQHEKLAFEELTKATVKGVPGQYGTGFAPGVEGAWNHVQGALHKDPGIFLGAESMGVVPSGSTFTDMFQNFTDHTTSRLEALQGSLAAHVSGESPLSERALYAIQKEIPQVKFMQNLIPQGLVDQEAVPLSVAKAYDDFANPVIRLTDKEAGLYEAFDSSGKSMNVGLEDNGAIHLPGDKSIADSDYFDVLRLFRAGNTMVKDLSRKVGDDTFQWTIPDSVVDGKLKPSWFHLDMAEQLMKDTDGRANINWGKLTPETAQKESLIQKITQMKGLDLDSMDPGEMQKLRVRFNLPRMNSYQMGVLGTTDSPLDVLMRGAMDMSPSQLKNMSISDFREAYAGVNNIGDLAKIDASQVKSLAGNSFKFMLDDQGSPVSPILMLKRNIAPADFSPDYVAERIGAKKIAQSAMLTGPMTDDITREVVGGIMANPDYQLGSQVSGLNDSQITSSIPGFGNNQSQTAFGSLRNSVVTAEWRARDNPQILAVTRLRETVQRQVQGYWRDVATTAMGDAKAVLQGPRNLASQTLLDNFQSFRTGWDLEPKSIKISGQDGQQMNGFVLSDTVANQKRFLQQFGRKMDTGQTLLDSRGKDVVVDDMGLDVQNRMNQITDTSRKMKNSLLAARGLPEISHTPWYVPAPDLTGKYVGFTFDSENNIIPGAMVIAPTKQAFDQELARIKVDPDSALNRLPGAKFRTRDDIDNFASLWDRAQMEMVNPGTTPIAGQKSSQGFLTGTYTNVGRLQDSMRTIQNNFLNHANDIMDTMLDDPIKAMQQRANIAGGVTRNADSKQMPARSIYDYWIEAAQGRSPLAANASMVAQAYNTTENGINGLLREAQPKVNNVWSLAKDFISQANPFAKDPASVKTFQTLADKLGPFMPFESAAEMVERQGVGANPWKLGDLTGAGNRFTATWLLRMEQVAQPIMNLSGVVNAMPSIIRHISAKEGESAADVAARIGQNANIFTSDEGRVFSTLDMSKVMWNGFKRAWSRTSDADYDFMVKNGYLGSEVGEYQRSMNAIEDKSSLMKFLTGDSKSSSAYAQRGLLGHISLLSDKSEDFSRSWSHFVGLELADMSGITEQAAAHNFAHDIANKSIANYSPLNRPEIFQGAVGSTVGLFQSFMWAYYQRMFRYIETGDKGAAAIQMAMQGTLYGAKTVPGFAQVNQMFFDHSDGKKSPYDTITHAFGHSAGDMIMNGTLSNLPKLFGADGASLYTRGDVTPRIPTDPINAVENSAAVSMFRKIAGGIGNAAHLFSKENPDLNMQQVGEVLSNMMPNRPLAGIIEQTMAHGYDTDGKGQVVSQAKTWMDAAYRMIGLRSETQASQVEAFYANKQAQELSAAQTDQYNTMIRGSIRNKDFDSIPGYINKYLQNGGDPRNVTRMLKDAYQSAIETRSERQLSTVIRSQGKSYMTQRLLDAHVGIGTEAKTDSPQSRYGVPDPMDGPEPQSDETANTMAYGVQ